ncbi:MAG: Lon protease family protein [Acidaminococcaceae bacterium]
MENEVKDVKKILPIKELTAEQLHFYCKEEFFDFETTATVPPLQGMIGQERAVNAVEFGLHTKNLGYNIFISGMVGTGRMTYAEHVVSEEAKGQPVPLDWCYVNNFDDASRPLTISLPSGKGSIFCQDMQELMENLRNHVPKAFSSEDYERERTEIMKSFQEKRGEMLQTFVDKAETYSVLSKWSPTGFMMVPLLNGKPVSEEEFQKLPDDKKEKIKKNLEAVHDLAMEVIRQVQDTEKDVREKIRDLDSRVAMFAVGHLIDEVQEKYKYSDDIVKYLEAVRGDVVKNINDFKQTLPSEEENVMSLFKKSSQEVMKERYTVNLFVDNRTCKGAPVIIETNPNYYNLCGRVEYSSRMGAVSTDFTMIKPGSFHLANGGYLIVNAMDVLSNPGVWEAMKRILKTRKLTIESLGEQYGLIAMASLKPQAIPVNVKVIMLGSTYLYHLMYQYDEDFRKLFKIHADFDADIDNTPENITKMANFVSVTVKKEHLKDFTRAGVARVIEYIARLGGSQNKFTARFNQVVEILCEADSWASLEGASIIDFSHVQKAIDEKRYRANKYEERIHEMFKEGLYLIDTEDAKVGQINGLAVLGIGEYAFGKPSRITANTYLGRAGVVNIERETKMSGATHSKGVLTLSGYLGNKYAQKMPLSLTASLTFEQLYEGIDGDSASSAELYAILSSLAEVPLRQDIAVTGSVNQKGEIQPIGGVTEKIEGFYEVCKIKGMTGQQGVMIPAQNVRDLALNGEIVEAVKNGKFHIYYINSVDEGIELLTGNSAGVLDSAGLYPAKSVHGLVMAKLKTYHDAYLNEKRAVENQESSKNADEEF